MMVPRRRKWMTDQAKKAHLAGVKYVCLMVPCRSHRKAEE